MKIYENMLLRYNEGKVVRILYENRKTSIIYVIDLDANRMPYPQKREMLVTHLKTQEVSVEDERGYNRVILEEELSESEKLKRDHAWEMIMFLIRTVENEELIYLSKYRERAIKEVCQVFKVSYNTVKNYLIRYWKGGKIRNSLLPNYFNCGGRGKERKVSGKKRGRPRLRDVHQGINVDDHIKKMFKIGLNRYYYNERNNSLKTTYELILKDFFTTEQVTQNGVTIPILPKSSELPTYHQFLYWYKKFNNLQREVSSRKGTRVYHQNYRSIIGDSTQDAGMGPATLWQIDSTVFDMYCVSSFNRDLIVGKPTLFLTIDVYSRLIVGINITFESLNSYTGAMVALANSMLPKKEFCAKYGIDIAEEDWPVACVPKRILADRGELNGKQIENAIQHLGISIQNSPPYRADYKGIIEASFHQLNLKVKPFVDGAVINGKNQSERGQSDYRLKASLTVEELYRIVIKCVLFHNNYHVLSHYIVDEMMLEDEVEKIPVKIWEHGLQNKIGQLRTLPEEVIITHLFPSDQAKITPKGVLFRKMLYASEYALKSGWFQIARIKGSSTVKICYDPRDLKHIYVFEENGLQKLALLDHLLIFSNKGLEEIEQIKKYEQEVDMKSKEKELQEKMKLFKDIEQIVKDGRQKTDVERDDSKSKSKKIKGIKENQRVERLLQRQKAMNVQQDVNLVDSDMVLGEESEDELALFRQMQALDWEDRDE
ncbi:DNA-binding protein [Mesorhizobium sp. M00.F.Ca.ET.186.01.1.1]|uniref:transposase family protein n=1 Tax=Brevibacillus borstelensis TaxID=45462 RepID=UPI001133B232|nr:transposase family protein [Brevibacillus borstelensis]MCM3591260.1 transposase family protein [Brevibacillus borstelensis]TGV30828.1 DNA-binding protein [Mesorhizobium sp. M00.F.Ca.ET.186.01.1.1]